MGNKKALGKFLMTLAATTVSIVLTFGTTAIIDRKKQKAEKREMVMMVMYDMRESLKEIERCNEDLKSFFDTQLDVVAHPEKMDGSYPFLAANVPMVSFTGTTETIFRSNIETIRTIGNILFVEAVSSFYDGRNRYKTQVVDDFLKESGSAMRQFEILRDFDSPLYAFNSELYLRAMKGDFEQCKLMMKVTDEELEVFSVQQRKLLDATQGDVKEATANVATELVQRRMQLQQAREAGEMELGR